MKKFGWLALSMVLSSLPAHGQLFQATLENGDYGGGTAVAPNSGVGERARWRDLRGDGGLRQIERDDQLSAGHGRSRAVSQRGNDLLRLSRLYNSVLQPERQ